MQKTPIRVLHRRTSMVREKVLYQLSTEYINAHWFFLDLVSSSGTYIKEFVHGDRGRTVPNVAQILKTNTQIIQLDVTGVSAGLNRK